MAHIHSQFPGNGVRHFTVANAARDVDEFMQAYNTQRAALGLPARRKYVYSVSFGTYLANKFLQIKSHKIEAIVFDSVVTSFYGGFMEGDAIYSQKVYELFTMCDNEYIACGRHFAGVQGGSAVGTLAYVVDSFKSGKPSGSSPAACAARAGVIGPNKGHLRNVFSSTVAANSLTAPLAIGVVLRLARCSDQDVTELSAYSPLKQEFAVGVPGASLRTWPGTMWAFQTYFSEMWAQTRPEFTSAGMQLQADDGISVALGPYGHSLMQRWRAAGLAYTPEPSLWGKFPNFTETPTLMMSGGMDSNAPPEWARKTFEANPGIVWKYYPGVTHVVINAPQPCGGHMLSVVLAFLSSGGQTVLQTPCDNVSQTFLGGSNDITNAIVKGAFGGNAQLYGEVTPSPTGGSPSCNTAHLEGVTTSILVMVIMILVTKAVQCYFMRTAALANNTTERGGISLVTGSVRSDQHGSNSDQLEETKSV